MSAAVTALRTAKAPSAKRVWLSPEQVCEQVPGMTEVILSERRKSGLKPDYHKPSKRTVVYEQAEIDRWIESTRVSTRDSA